jgi:type II secretory pathway pseudopilin PulG
MAALLVAMSVMAILMTAAMPVWKQTAQREKEAELVFRGQQYVHAVQLFQRRAGPGTYPPSVDFMVQQKFLRKKYKDPITNGDFVPLSGAIPVAPPAAGAPGVTNPAAPTGGPASPAPGPATVTIGPDGAVPGGVAGVVSKSTDKSIRIYNGQTHYNEWVFRAIPPAAATGAGAPGAGGAGQRGGPPGSNQQPNGAGGFGGNGRGPRGGGPQRFGGPNGAANGPPNGGRGFQALPDGRVVPNGNPAPPGR